MQLLSAIDFAFRMDRDTDRGENISALIDVSSSR